MSRRYLKFALFFLFLNILTIRSFASAESTIANPKTLEGRWEGTVSTSWGWSSPFYLEIFEVNTEDNSVMFRGSCPKCDRSEWYRYKVKLINDKNKVGFETPWYGGVYELSNDTLRAHESGTDVSYGAYYRQYLLMRVPKEKYLAATLKDIIGKWKWTENNNWRELIIQSVDNESRTFKGIFRRDDGTDNELFDTKLMIDNGTLKLTFKVAWKETHSLFNLTYYPQLETFVPVLAGSAETKGKIAKRLYKKME